jgi:hypothetical protein
VIGFALEAASALRHSRAAALAHRTRARQNPPFVFQQQFFHPRPATINLPGGNSIQ